MDKLQKCVDEKKVNNSRTREIIYKILYKSDECLNIDQIVEISSTVYPKKISINTIYRHLRFFMENELIFVVQNNLKVTYYCLCSDNTSLLHICTKCNSIKKINSSLANEFLDSDFITIHKKCKECE
ncbi:MAG: transcriptional repressor [Campylobacterota bacterium]|nr:transcriptional repressor [Campylobacterota bacterium]